MAFPNFEQTDLNYSKSVPSKRSRLGTRRSTESDIEIRVNNNKLPQRRHTGLDETELKQSLSSQPSTKISENVDALDFTHLQDQCHAGTTYIDSMIRMLSKVGDGYDKFSKNIKNSVDSELHLLHKFNSDPTKSQRIDNMTGFLSSWELLCAFLKDLSLCFSQICNELKTSMTSPLTQWKKKTETKYTSIYKKHEQSYHKYQSDIIHMNSFKEVYKKLIEDEKHKFELISLLSKSTMPPNDHKIYKKSWHSPSKLGKSVSRLLIRAKSTTSFSTKRLSSLAQLSPRNIATFNGNDNSTSNSNGSYLSPVSSLSTSADEHKDVNNSSDEEEQLDIYSKNTKMELDEWSNNKNKEHCPLLFAVLTYATARNKLKKQELHYLEQIHSANRSMEEYKEIRKETMNEMKNIEIGRLNESKKIYCCMVSMVNSEKFQIHQRTVFKDFEQSTQILKPQTEFGKFVHKSFSSNTNKYRSIIDNHKYKSPQYLSTKLHPWISSYHLMEDLMEYPQQKKSYQALKVPFIFEYLMEHIETAQALKDPDIFMINPMLSPTSVSISASPMSSDGAIARKTSFPFAFKPQKLKNNSLNDDIIQLFECNAIDIIDHHRACRLLKVWLFKCPDGLVPYYLFERICEFELIDDDNERMEFVIEEILQNLSEVRLSCLARFIKVCKDIVLEKNQITIIDLAYELSNIIIRDPVIEEWHDLKNGSGYEQSFTDSQYFNSQATLSPSNKGKRAEMVFVTFLLSNEIQMLTEREVTNSGLPLMAEKQTSISLSQSHTHLAHNKEPRISLDNIAYIDDEKNQTE